MYVAIKLKNKGDTKLFLQPDREGSDNSVFILVENEDDINKPYLKLKLIDSDFKILNERDIDEPIDILCEKLSELAIEVIAAQQRGDDLADINLAAQEKPYNPDKIRVESKTFSLKQIFDMIESGDLNLQPDFQRNLVWDNFRKSRLIESILLRIPLPMFYFSQDEEGILFVVDGLQRLSTIYEFMSNKFVLKDLEYLDNCNGKNYSNKNNKIDDRYVRWINMTQIVVNVIDSQSPSKVKYDIFRRINTGGRPLNAQELRNSLAGNGLRDTLKNMVSLPSFKKATGGSIKDTRMDAQELALRFIYFYNLKFDKNESIEKYTGLIDTELDELVDSFGKMPTNKLDMYVKKFDCAMNNAYHLFGRHAFRKLDNTTSATSDRSIINKALFASESVLLSQYSEATIREFPQNCMIKIFANEMMRNAEYYNYLSYGTNGRKNIITAFNVAEKIFRESLN